jgi:predicted phosphodiesterase
MPRVNIYVLSDIHLDRGQDLWAIDLSDVDQTSGEANILVVAGDTTDMREDRKEAFVSLLDRFASTFTYVVLVAGNHEYFHRSCGTLRDTWKFLQGASDSFSNVFFLERDSVTLSGVKFIGGTMWGLIGKENEASAQQKMPDYKFCSSGSSAGLLTPNDTNHIHNETVDYITEQADNTPKATIVVTHHCPFLDPHIEAGVTRELYCSDQSDLLRSGKITAWIYGHTHIPANFRYGPTRLISNPYITTKELRYFSVQ